MIINKYYMITKWQRYYINIEVYRILGDSLIF